MKLDQIKTPAVKDLGLPVNKDTGMQALLAKAKERKAAQASVVEPVAKPEPEPETIEQMVAAVTQEVSPPEPPASKGEKITDVFSRLPSHINKEEFREFYSSIDEIRQAMDNPDIVGQQLRRIMIDLQETPEFAEFLAPEDCGTMVRALRNSYGLAVVTKKAKSKGKSKTRGPKNEEERAALDDIANLMMDI